MLRQIKIINSLNAVVCTKHTKKATEIIIGCKIKIKNWLQLNLMIFFLMSELTGSRRNFYF